MPNNDNMRRKIVIDRSKEMRTKEISRMISEGGTGALHHYDIKKVSTPKKEIKLNDTEIKARREKK